MIIYFYNFLFFLIPTWIIFRIIYFKKVHFSLQKEILVVILLIYCLFVLGNINLFPIIIGMPNYFTYPDHNNFVPFKSIYNSFQHFYYVVPLKSIGGNILLLIPMGILVPLVWKKVNRINTVILIGLFCSFIIEFLQFVTPHRTANIDNLFLQTLGFVIGYFVLKILNHYFKLKNLAH
jgi:glycopeptide antibiotics resistance protein